MGPIKWKIFYENRWQPLIRRTTHELATLSRYLNKNMPISNDGLDVLAPKFQEIRDLLHKVEAEINAMENKTL